MFSEFAFKIFNDSIEKYHVKDDVYQSFENPYAKEDIEHLAYNVFSVGAAGGFNTEYRATKSINRIRDFQKYMPIFLDKHKIPYEMFSLDTGDYGKTFELDKVLPRDSTQTLWDNNDESIDVRQQVSKYLIENP